MKFKLRSILFLIAVIGTNFATAQIADTAVGLKWLSLSGTLNWAFDEVQSQLGEEGTFAGYRYATPDEVWARMESHGFDQELAAMDNASAVLGFFATDPATYSSLAGGDMASFSGGMASDGTRFHIHFYQEGFYLPDSPPAVGWINTTSVDQGYSDPFTGHFLVQSLNNSPSPVPEPAHSVLAALTAAFAFVAFRRSRKAHSLCPRE